MSREQVYEELQEIFRDVFDDETIEINDATTAADIEEWDSLEQINLIMAIEKAFKVKFTIAEVGELQNVGEMVNAIVNKLN